jgi:hypothetical protein
VPPIPASGVPRLFELEIGTGRFLYHYDEEALDYERELLCGRYVLLTSLSQRQLPTEEVVRTYRGLLHVEDRFKVLKDFLGLRPVRHFTESRVRGHSGICVLAATIESLVAADLARADDTSATRTSPNRSSRPAGRFASCAGGASSGSTPAARRSRSSRGAPRCRPRSSPPSASTPPAGARPRSADQRE